jgi:cbb3-type cytochrome oxidase maturation protein
MFVIIILLVASLCVASGFLIAFLWASRSGQYDDINTPALRMLFDDSPSKKPV